MNIDETLTQIFREKSVVSVEFFGLNFVKIAVINHAGVLKIVDIFLNKCTVFDILEAIRQHTSGN